MDNIVINKLINYIIKNNSIPEHKLINCMRLGKQFYNILYNKFEIFNLYNYLCNIFEISLNICDKNTYLRRRLRCINTNYINYKQLNNVDLINNEYTIFMFVYNLYPMIHINLSKYEKIISNLKVNNIIKLFHYIEQKEIIKVVFYSKNDNKFLVKTLDNVSKIDEMENTLNNINTTTTEYHNLITSKLMCLQYIFINLKNINNK